MSKIEEIAAMKLDVIGRGGRKKDFWDIHELLEWFSLEKLFELYHERYPYNFTREDLIAGFENYNVADNDFEPICLKIKVWELIKLDLSEAIKKLK